MFEGSPQSLVESLISAGNAIALMGNYRKSRKKDCVNLARRINLLVPLFEEVRESQGPLPLAAVACFSSLRKTFESAKKLLRLCHDGSKLYLVLEGKTILGRFHALTEELDHALDGLPYDLLEISDEVQEQVELLHLQLKRAKGRAETQDIELCMDIMTVLSQKDGRDVDSAILERLADKLELQTISDLAMESKTVKKLIIERGGEMGETLEQMLFLLKKLKGMLDMESLEQNGISLKSLILSTTMSDKINLPTLPKDFCCPISLDLMKDPVIVATGQTYERVCIQKWFDSGHKTCPKTQQVLPHLILTPNYVLRNLIAEWCEMNGIDLPRKMGTNWTARLNNRSDIACGDGMGIDNLVQNLSCMQTNVQRDAAGELRLLAKRSANNRISIAEAGAVPLLVKLLSSTDPKTQEHAVTALLNLSIHESNKDLIVQVGAIYPIIEVLKHGSMEARENSAATLFSLSVVDGNKSTIGALGAIPALVDLLRDGTARGKKDAATALFNLLMYQGNKTRAVRAGIVPLLLRLLDESIGMVDVALAILAILAPHQEGRIAIGHQSTIHSLVKLIRSGSARNKENAAAVLLALAVNDSFHLLTALQLGVYESLIELVQNGTARAKRKATALLEHMSKHEQGPGYHDWAYDLCREPLASLAKLDDLIQEWLPSDIWTKIRAVNEALDNPTGIV